MLLCGCLMQCTNTFRSRQHSLMNRFQAAYISSSLRRSLCILTHICLPSVNFYLNLSMVILPQALLLRTAPIISFKLHLIVDSPPNIILSLYENHSRQEGGDGDNASSLVAWCAASARSRHLTLTSILCRQIPPDFPDILKDFVREVCNLTSSTRTYMHNTLCCAPERLM